MSSFTGILGFQKSPTGLVNESEIWYVVFVWCLASSILIYTMAAGFAFFTLGKHRFGRFYSLLIFLMGFVIPITLGAVSSACIAFVYKTSSFTMGNTHALMWGVGMTIVHAAFGTTRIMATL